MWRAAQKTWADRVLTEFRSTQILNRFLGDVLASGDPLAAALAGRNDLEPPARALRPAIGDVVALLAERPGAILARMSGSGATCFALFGSEDDRDAADRAIAASRPDWWRLASRVR